MKRALAAMAALSNGFAHSFRPVRYQKRLSETEAL